MLPVVFKKCIALFALCALCSSASAYELTTPYQSGHFALNQVVLEPHETFDDSLRYEITREVQTRNRLHKLYQSSTAVFPADSLGLKGPIGQQMLGVLSIANYSSGQDQIVFNTNAHSATYAGLYFSFAQLKDFIDKKALNSLIPEIMRLPLVITDIPVARSGFDSRGSFYLTARNLALILDLHVEDSVYYTKAQLHAIQGNGKCRIDALVFPERIVPDLPLFISARAAVNYMHCDPAK